MYEMIYNEIVEAMIARRLEGPNQIMYNHKDGIKVIEK